ncbi:hypothetical protein SODALDRAFT_360135 [Sodiomyces alkalinus F11]|uniref:Uncharacterized protein n=1 Tax=Sodiomyces alkalinus (strain CBS 110278 / VKM F-3762 / F11) TaxID=1314773 RepID=A0A3N2PTL1_SODAK|nr:hypothetical protein SODALDRAFT_360135 [Sodiomyces alkalinus F11]ROT37842.1 hypothetical protein SODALDRAFT_360135 [Sodiomyces alkalinus F11]
MPPEEEQVSLGHTAPEAEDLEQNHKTRERKDLEKDHEAVEVKGRGDDHIAPGTKDLDRDHTDPGREAPEQNHEAAEAKGLEKSRTPHQRKRDRGQDHEAAEAKDLNHDHEAPGKKKDPEQVLLAAPETKDAHAQEVKEDPCAARTTWYAKPQAQGYHTAPGENEEPDAAAWAADWKYWAYPAPGAEKEPESAAGSEDEVRKVAAAAEDRFQRKTLEEKENPSLVPGTKQDALHDEQATPEAEEDSSLVPEEKEGSSFVPGAKQDPRQEGQAAPEAKEDSSLAPETEENSSLAPEAKQTPRHDEQATPETNQNPCQDDPPPGSQEYARQKDVGSGEGRRRPSSCPSGWRKGDPRRPR